MVDVPGAFPRGTFFFCAHPLSWGTLSLRVHARIRPYGSLARDGAERRHAEVCCADGKTW